jgi:hypothetical protein
MLGADRPHHLVEGTDELGVPVADQEPDGSTLVLRCDCEVTSLLGDPGPARGERSRRPRTPSCARRR